MTTLARNPLNNPVATTTETRIDQTILWITLGSLFMIPLLFSYFQIVAVYSELRVALLHLAAGSVAVLWLWQVVLVWYQDEGKTKQGVSWDLMDWTRSNPARWTIVALAIFVFVQLASTLLSPLPIISFFGGDDARSGYNLYDSLSLTVLLFTVAFRLRSERKLELLAYTLVISGTIAAVYGTAQHFGWDPIGENGGRTRAIASFGNTLNFRRLHGHVDPSHDGGLARTQQAPATLHGSSHRCDRHSNYGYLVRRWSWSVRSRRCWNSALLRDRRTLIAKERRSQSCRGFCSRFHPRSHHHRSTVCARRHWTRKSLEYR